MRVAVTTVDLSDFAKLDPNSRFSETTSWPALVDKIIGDLRQKINEFNQTPGQGVQVNVACPALHLLEFFTLFECIKNSLYARATSLIIAVDYMTDSGMVSVTIKDNGPRVPDKKRMDFGEYPYRDALLQHSEKRGDVNSLGGNGLGVAMSRQFAYLFGLDERATLFAGHREEGFEVSILSGNKPTEVKWNHYLYEFGPFLEAVRGGCRIPDEEINLRRNAQQRAEYEGGQRERHGLSDFFQASADSGSTSLTIVTAGSPSVASPNGKNPQGDGNAGQPADGTSQFPKKGP